MTRVTRRFLEYCQEFFEVNRQDFTIAGGATPG
jgi:hypothetical protein